MADDHYSRPPRPSNPLARPQSGPRASQSGGDPLAELARLIGQQDPYAAYAQTPPSDSRRSHDQYYAQDGQAGASDGYQAPHDPYAHQPDHQDGYGVNEPYNPPSSYQEPSYAPPHAAGQAYDDRGYDDRDYGGQNYSDPGYGGQAYREPPAFSQRGYAEDAAYQDQNYAAQDPTYAPDNADGYAPQSYAPAPQPYADPQYSERAFDPHYGGPQQDAPQFASPQYDDKPYPAYDNQLYSRQAPAFPQADPYAAQHGAVPNGQGAPDGYYTDPHSPAYGVPYFQDQPVSERDEAPARRRGGLVTVLAVLALAVVGTAGAFGYRAVFSTAGTSGPPPVIKADTTPSKIVPAANDSTKPIQDRVGDRAQLERLITREEQPVDVNAARAPRVVFPGPNPIAPMPNSPIPASPTTQTSGATGSAASTEPKRIRTVTIRSDQPELAAVAQAATASAPRMANAASGVLPEDDQANAHPQANANGPLALSPGAAQRSAPARIASAPATHAPATAGGYSVQVTSQRSEGEAQAAYSQLQSKFPSVLGGHQAIIRRADLGEKGTYYRAQIPFGSQGEAADFCINLRNAGGQCVVQRN